MKKPVFTTVLATLAIGAMATMGTAQSIKPPTNFSGQWWTHPSGCQYSRAGRPGETMWFLVINTAKKGCPSYIAGKTWGDVYKAEGPKVGS